MTEYNTLLADKQQKFVSHSSGRREAQVKVLAEPVPGEGSFLLEASFSLCHHMAETSDSLLVYQSVFFACLLVCLSTLFFFPEVEGVKCRVSHTLEKL